MVRLDLGGTNIVGLSRSGPTENDKPAEYRGLEKITLKRFENCVIQVEPKTILGKKILKFKTAFLITEFGLSFVVNNNEFPDTLFYNDSAYEDYNKWAAINTEKWREFKEIIRGIYLEENSETPCIVIDYYKYTLFGLFGPPRHEVKAYIFSQDYQLIFQELNKRVKK